VGIAATGGELIAFLDDDEEAPPGWLAALLAAQARYQADVAGDAVRQRVERDKQDGAAAGVGGTPTFFLNGEIYQGQNTYAGLKAAVDAALAG